MVQGLWALTHHVQRASPYREQIFECEWDRGRLRNLPEKGVVTNAVVTVFVRRQHDGMSPEAEADSQSEKRVRLDTYCTVHLSHDLLNEKKFLPKKHQYVYDITPNFSFS